MKIIYTNKLLYEIEANLEIVLLKRSKYLKTNNMFYDDLFSKEEIDECMKMHNFKCSTDYVLNYWRKKSWKTLKIKKFNLKKI